ncbi:MAG: hypothetical protein H6R10_3134 [Rhodocyclaceae bacterium]|nr:hypothetical protein [Rhodocyclaceae bacterium]
MSAAVLYGPAAWVVLLGAAASFLPRGRRLPVALGAMGLGLAPLLAGESLAMALHGAFAAPSFTLLQLALRRLLAPRSPGYLGAGSAGVLLMIALVFYPPALGLGPFDPYGLGYQPLPLLLALLPLAGWLAWRRQQGWLVILGGDLLAYAAGLFGNLWDALFDPLLVLLAAATLVAAWISRRRSGRSVAGRW